MLILPRQSPGVLLSGTYMYLDPSPEVEQFVAVENFSDFAFTNLHAANKGSPMLTPLTFRHYIHMHIHI